MKKNRVLLKFVRVNSSNLFFYVWDNGWFYLRKYFKSNLIRHKILWQIKNVILLRLYTLIRLLASFLLNFSFKMDLSLMTQCSLEMSIIKLG